MVSTNSDTTGDSCPSSGASVPTAVELLLRVRFAVLGVVGAEVGLGTNVRLLLLLLPSGGCGSVMVYLLMDMKLQDPAVKDENNRATKTTMTREPLMFFCFVFKQERNGNGCLMMRRQENTQEIKIPAHNGDFLSQYFVP